MNKSLLFFAVLFWLLAGRGFAAEPDPAIVLQRTFLDSKKALEAHPQDPELAWRFARATFDVADLAANNGQRADVAEQGINACKKALADHSNSAPLHYYLGLNQGELARTRTLGALKLVDQMEREFMRAIELDATFDYAGPERSLGLLYRDAPVLASIGSRSKARQHLQRALELAPLYPDNRLNMIESEIKWGDRKGARQQLKLLEDGWAAARSEFNGAAWAASWSDWSARLEKVKKTLEEPARLESPRH